MAENVTGGDLYRLWRVGEVHLPRLADVFYDSSRVLGGAIGSATGFPAHDSPYPGSSFRISALGAAWEDLRATMQALMTHAGDVVMDTAHGVGVARQVYDQIDAASGRSILETYMESRGRHDDSQPSSNPPAAGSADYPVRPDSAALRHT